MHQENELKTKSKLSLHNLPLKDFMTCIIDEDLSCLDGDQELWDRLYLEFIDNISQSKSTLSVEKNYYYYCFKVARLQFLIDCAKLRYLPGLLSLFKEEGFNYPFTEESYIEDLEKVVARCKRYVILKGQYETQLNKKENKEVKLDYKYFSDTLNAISEMVKYNVDENISTLRFCSYYNKLIAYIEKQENARQTK